MKDCIVGCGAIGSLFAAHLATLDDVEVWAYDLDNAHVDAINKGGLRLSVKSTLHSRPKASNDTAAIPPCDFGIVATKSLHTRPAMEVTAAIFRNGAVCSVQNGVGNEEIIAFVEPTPGSTIEVAELLALVERQLAPYKKPQQIIVLPQLPVAPNGKIRKHDLKKRAEESLSAATSV